jgi:hypothetical protein
MTGQKKRRKRFRQGTLAIGGAKLAWKLISEPQFTSHGFKGLCVSVRLEDERHRELILEYAFPRDPADWKPTLPQRPAFSEKQIETDVRRAMAKGWEPESRGKTFVFRPDGD